MGDTSLAQWFLAAVLIISSLGVILLKNPVHATLSFLVTLLGLALIYLQLSASFVAVMQVLIYAGAILVIFMFVIVLFQDAHQQIAQFEPKSNAIFLMAASAAFLLSLMVLGKKFIGFAPSNIQLPKDFGTVQALGKDLFINFFFPFEAVILLFLIAVIGSLYIGKKVR